MSESIVGRVVRVMGDGRVVVNVGLVQGIAPGDAFVVFDEGEEITDPDSGEPLGRLENVKLRVEAVHVQERLSQLAAASAETPSESPVLSARLADTQVRRSRQDRVRVGDRVRRVPRG
jgi:hypothetical protein